MDRHDTGKESLFATLKTGLKKKKSHGQRLLFPLGVLEILVQQISLGNEWHTHWQTIFKEIKINAIRKS